MQLFGGQPDQRSLESVSDILSRSADRSESLVRREASPSDSFAQRLPTSEEVADSRIRMALAMSAGLVGAGGVLLIGLLVIAVVYFSRQPRPAPLVPSSEDLVEEAEAPAELESSAEQPAQTAPAEDVAAALTRCDVICEQ